MKNIQLIFQVLVYAPKSYVFAVVAFLVLAGLTESIGLMLLVPIMSVLSGEVANNSFVQSIVSGLDAIGIPTTLPGLLTIFFALIVLRSSVQVAKSVVDSRLQLKIVTELRRNSLKEIMSAEWSWITSGKRSDKVNMIVHEVSRVGIGVHYAISLTTTFVMMIIYAGVATALSIQLTFLVLISACLVFLLTSSFLGQAFRIGVSLGESNRELVQNVTDSLAGLKHVRILGAEKNVLSSLADSLEKARASQIRYVVNRSLSSAVFQVLAALILVAIIIFSRTLTELPFAELLVLVFIFLRLIPQLMSAQQLLNKCVHALPAIQEVEDFFQEVGAHRIQRHENLATSEELWQVNDGISLENITLRHEAREAPALNEITAFIPAKKLVVITGQSGAGKSTLADLLTGLLTHDTGEIRIDGRLLSKADRTTWMQSVAYLPQEGYLFAGSIKKNLLIAKPDATDAELISALERASAGFVVSFPNGIETVVGDDGVRLSGGEKQRISLARTLLRAPALLILDEATSALDKKNESEIFDVVTRLRGELTIIVITHDPQIAKLADQVIILDCGKPINSHNKQDIGTWLEPKQ